MLCWSLRWIDRGAYRLKLEIRSAEFWLLSARLTHNNNEKSAGWRRGERILRCLSTSTRYIAWAVILSGTDNILRDVQPHSHCMWWDTAGSKADKAARRAAPYLLNICRCTQAWSWAAAAICVQIYFHTWGSGLETGQWTVSALRGAYLTASAKSKTRNQSQLREHAFFFRRLLDDSVLAARQN